MVRRSVLLVLLGLAVLVSGRAASAEVVKKVERIAPPLSFDRLGNVDGLPNSDVKTIVQDRRGFMWFGTQDGLVRYDGARMRVYKPVDNDPTSISSGIIVALAMDATGKIWVGTADAGINLYDPETDKFAHYTKATKGGPSSDGVVAIVRDNKDRMWFAMGSGGIDRYDPATNTFSAYTTGPLETTITAMAVDKSDTLWLGTETEGVVRWNPNTGQTVAYRPAANDEHGLGATGVKAILIPSTGQVWIATDGDGLFSFDPNGTKFIKHRHSPSDFGTISDDHVTALFEDRHQNLWIGTLNGLNRMDPQGHIVQFQADLNDSSTLAFPQVETVFQDAGGVIWVGGFTGGVCRFDELRPKFGRYHVASHDVVAYFEDDDGTLWAGTYVGGLFHYDFPNQRVTVYHTLGARGTEGSVPLDTLWITGMRRDKRGLLWITTKGGGLVNFDDRGTEKYTQYLPNPDKPGSIPVDSMMDLYVADDGNVWLATLGGGLVKFEPQAERFTAITTDQQTGLTSNFLYRIYPDPVEAKVLWLGTVKGGVVRFDLATGSFTAFRHKDDDPTTILNDDVTSIYRDKEGSLWVATFGGGFARLDPKTGKGEHWTTGNSQLTNDTVLGILPDDEGKLWLITNGGGLVKFDPKDKSFIKYDSTDGLQDNEFSMGSFLRGHDGKLYVGGPSGFNAFYPKDITRDPYLPPIVLTAFKDFNQDIKLDAPIWTLPKIEVSYTDSFELQFAALSFAAPGRNRYAYKLEGFDDKFIETERPFATYTKLSGGHYTLKVRAANRHGVWNEAALAISIAVKPPFWRTWPAFAIYIALLGIGAFILFRIQQNRLRRAEREGRLAVVERDLALSGAVQSGFLPDYNEIQGRGVQLYGFYRAADACSGDWWWHELYGTRHVILVGDVTGHGPGPAMVTAAVATAFRVVSAGGIADVKQCLDLLNQVVLNVAKGKYHMTMCALEVEETTGQWTVHSAGAPPILSLDPRGKHKVYFCPGAPLGTETDFEIGRLEGQMAPTERLMLYTDGIPELALPNGNVLGLRRFAQIYERTRGQTVGEAAASIVQLADQNRAGVPQGDDWTFTIVEWQGVGAQGSYY